MCVCVCWSWILWTYWTYWLVLISKDLFSGIFFVIFFIEKHVISKEIQAVFLPFSSVHLWFSFLALLHLLRFPGVVRVDIFALFLNFGGTAVDFSPLNAIWAVDFFRSSLWSWGSFPSIHNAYIFFSVWLLNFFQFSLHQLRWSHDFFSLNCYYDWIYCLIVKYQTTLAFLQ